MKKVLKTVSNILVWLVVIVAVAMMIFTIVSVNTFGRNDRALFGYKAFIVLSDSMSATDFDSGDLVVVKEVADPSTLQPGDIISYQSLHSSNYGETVTHKIRERTVNENGDPGFITYGTTTGTDDEIVVTYPFVQGKYQFAIPHLGEFFVFLKTPLGYVTCILVPFLLLIFYQAINCVKIFRQYKAEQMAELQAEKDAIEAERKRSEAVMEELRIMQAQMAANLAAQAPPPAAESQPAPVPQPAAQTVPAEPRPEPVEQPAEQAAPAAEPQPDMAAVMAELAALRAQLAATQKETAGTAAKDE